MNGTPSFAGLRVATLESRRISEMVRLIERRGGIPFASPAMREVEIEDDRTAIDFANRLITGQVDLAIFLTGVGTRLVVERIERHVPRQHFLDALSDIQTVARGPKPAAALRELGITPSIQVSEPNTWREILAAIDEHLSIANLVVALQEYGVSDVSLVAGLEARGANVLSIPIYRWALPEDLTPLETNIRRIILGEVDVLLVTSAQQVVHLLQVARQIHQEASFRDALQQIVTASIGPTTSQRLRELNLPVDLEASHAKMGHLVNEAAEQAHALLQKKQRTHIQLPMEKNPNRSLPAWHESPFMRACRRETVAYTPIWLMRQAGRYMAEYRAVRNKTTFLELCKNPQRCSEVMCTAVERLGVDAAIIFSDLLPILEPMGLHLEFVAGDGPKINNPVRQASDVDRIVALQNLDELQFVVETVTQTRKDLPESIPLIGFAGAPFTLASYAIEGGSSRSFLHTKTLMYREPQAWNELMQRLSHSIVLYLNAQIAAGAQAVQLFDSWVGCLATEDYRRFVLPHVRAIADRITPGTPLIHFGTGNPALLPLMAEAGGDVIGVDWRVPLADAWQSIGKQYAIQGNLDPTVLLADRALIAQRAKKILDEANQRPGHIFNLGHGVLQQTPVENVRYLVDFVHEHSAR